VPLDPVEVVSVKRKPDRLMRVPVILHDS
jgi:hypothetical protein